MNVIPSNPNRKESRDFDKNLYKERNLIERMFNKIKHFRRIAIRCDKTATAFLALFPESAYSLNNMATRPSIARFFLFEF